MLESEGLVEIRSRKGAFVTKVSTTEIEETYVVMKAVNVAAAGLAATHMTERRKKELRSIMRQTSRLTTGDRMEKVKICSSRLHDFIIKASENRLLQKIQKSLDHQQERFRASGAGFEKDDIADMVREHLGLSEALLEGDGARTEALMTDHLEKARLRLLKALEKNAEAVAIKPAEGFIKDDNS